VTGYADPELLVSKWLAVRLGIKVFVDPVLPANSWAQAPVAHMLRGRDQGDAQLTLDVALLDVDVYSAIPDHARETAEAIRGVLRLELPRYTFDNGAFVTAVQTVMAPCWTPDPKVSRRSASYRVGLHGMVA
jgi:hypothetical protein